MTVSYSDLTGSDSQKTQMEGKTLSSQTTTVRGRTSGGDADVDDTWKMEGKLFSKMSVEKSNAYKYFVVYSTILNIQLN